MNLTLNVESDELLYRAAFAISGHENYAVTDKGIVYSLNYNHTNQSKSLKPGKRPNGYLFVVLCKDNKKYYKSIHRLVAEAFLPDYSEELQVNHINGIKTDNRLENLEMCTQKENNIHAYKLGLKKGMKGEYHPMSKLTLKDVIEIRDLAKVLTHKRIADIYNVSRSRIWHILSRRNWK